VKFVKLLRMAVHIIRPLCRQSDSSKIHSPEQDRNRPAEFGDGGDAASIGSSGLHEKERQVIEELECVVLTRDLPSSGLKAGDIGTVVMVFGGGEAYDVEFTTLDGETFALETLPADALRPVRSREIAQAREVA